MSYSHQPVLLDESINYLKCKQGGVYVDGTLGRGGHTEEILKRIEDNGMVIGIDRDIIAIETVKKRLENYSSLKLYHRNFSDLTDILSELGINDIDGMIFDLGVSSPQFDNQERGFSYRYNAPLDMRMDRNQKLTAKKIVNH